MATLDLTALARTIAAQFSLDPALVCAVIEQESSWVTTVTRFEPGFLKRYEAKESAIDNIEAQFRSTSFGLMQVMGENAREMGFDGDLGQLLQPQIGLHYGCQLLKSKLSHTSGNVHDALQEWNGGANPNYAEEVVARVPKYQLPKSPAATT